jgi:hypothetical protein
MADYGPESFGVRSDNRRSGCNGFSRTQSETLQP